jgi:hypothetical protein
MACVIGMGWGSGVKQAERALAGFVGDFLAAVHKQDGFGLAECLRVTTNGFHTAKMIGQCRDAAIDVACAPLGAVGWHRGAASFLRALLAAAGGSWMAAHHHLLLCVAEFGTLFNAAKTNWMLPALTVLVREALAVTSAAEAYVVTTGDGARSVALEELAAKLGDLYRWTQDRVLGAESKKWGTPTVVNALLRLNFRVHSLRRCLPYVGSVVRLFGGPGAPPSDHPASVLPDDLVMANLPLSQAVTFAYYQGRLAMYEENFVLVGAQLHRGWLLLLLWSTL